MRVPVALAEAFGPGFQKILGEFASSQKLMEQPSDLESVRFIARSITPHVQKLSDLFNRSDRLTDLTPAKEQSAGLSPYWKSSSNPTNLRLAYFLYFMPPNLFRMASVWSELSRLGYRWPEGRVLRGIDFGAGPSSAACGIAAGELFSPVGLPTEGNWALIEQEKAILELGASWAQTYFESCQKPNWATRTFHRQLDLEKDWLPQSAPRFNLWVMSYFLNESELAPEILAKTLIATWNRHLEDEGMVILVEPALKAQSRKLLTLRKALIAENSGLQILLPCLGHQECGALAAPEDWCHEEVTWWRPPYLREIDKQAGLDRKSLPFSYLVIAKTKRSREEILPRLRDTQAAYRLVSPPHKEGRDQEFFMCGPGGKLRARLKKPNPPLERGDLLLDPDFRGSAQSTRIEKTGRLLPEENQE